MTAGGTRARLRDALAEATRLLADAGIDSARTDAELLAAHVVGVERGRLTLADPPADFQTRYRELIAARSSRVPLQHLTGTAAFGPLNLEVGAGVFVPRPETEALLEWAQHRLAGCATDAPLVVDLCTGSGALAIALAVGCPSARVIAVDDSAAALRYAVRNADRHGVADRVEFVEADVLSAGLRPDLDDRVHLVVSNPPYIPDGAQLDPEVADHDPHHALFGGADGMREITAISALAGRWLRPGGGFAVEHDDTTSAATVAVVEETGRFTDVRAHTDLAGRPRFVTAVRTADEERA